VSQGTGGRAGREEEYNGLFSPLHEFVLFVNDAGTGSEPNVMRVWHKKIKCLLQMSALIGLPATVQGLQPAAALSLSIHQCYPGRSHRNLPAAKVDESELVPRMIQASEQLSH